MNNLATIITQVILVPYGGGGLALSNLPILIILALMAITLVLMAMLSLLLYNMNKEEFFGKSLGPEYIAMTIFLDILSLIICYGGGSWFVYQCISELISRI